MVKKIINVKNNLGNKYVINPMEIALCYLNGNISSAKASWKQTPIALTAKTITTNRLSVVDGKIKIGKNIQHVRISYGFNIDFHLCASDVSFYARLTKNSATYHQQITTSKNTYCGMTASIVMRVKENDLIGLEHIVTSENAPITIFGSNGEYFETYLFIEILD